MRQLFFIMALSFIAHSAHAAPSSVFLEEMTWMEVKERMDHGAFIVIVPTGGTEQNGPHMALGKHNYIIRYTAKEIASQLGNALVAPVLAYVPEGRIDPPEGHMRFPGTISLSDKTFAAVLEETARSLKAHGFTLICFIGDSGGNQFSQEAVAKKLSAEWEGEGVRVITVNDYYYENNGQDEWLKSQGVEDSWTHAGVADTSELMAVAPEAVRMNRIAKHSSVDFPMTGATGDATQASSARGEKLLQMKIDAAVRQIHEAAGK